MSNVQPGPWVVETRGWGREPGTERTEHRTVEAPKDVGHDVYGVAEGSTIDLELRFEAVMDGVLVTGTASAHASGECVRCLEPIEDDPAAHDDRPPTQARVVTHLDRREERVQIGVQHGSGLAHEVRIAADTDTSASIRAPRSFPVGWIVGLRAG